MRVHVVGGGPAGLYYAYLMRRSGRAREVVVFEQNPPDVTFGFGVVLSGRALGFVAEGDEALVAALQKLMESWSDQHIVHRNQTVVVDGSAYGAIGRIALLDVLQRACREAGVELRFGTRVSAAEAADCDVLVGADGANSALRDAHADRFGTRVTDLGNFFAWYGVARPYPAHTLSFIRPGEGAFCGHHYRYGPGISTFVAETDAASWFASGLADMDEDGRRGLMERIFADVLGGQPLISNRSAWRRWRLVRNDRWHAGHMVLIGDALRTAHPSIGSGTRLAMEDAIALWRAFADAPTVKAAFASFEAQRRPVREKLDRAAERSIAWFEAMDERMALAPYDFAHDYLLRTGVMTPERLAREAPGFMQRHAAQADNTTPCRPGGQ